MPVTLINRCDVFVRVECAPPAELVTLLNTLFDLASHKINSLHLSQSLSLSCLHLRSQPRHLIHSLLIRAVQAIRVEYFPPVGLLRFFVPLALTAAHLLLSLNRRFKQVLLVLIDAFCFEVTLLQSLVLKKLLLRHLSFVKRVRQALLLLQNRLVIKLDGLVDLQLDLSLAPLERRESA